MWRNPKYPAPPPTSAPAERGERLLALDRNMGKEQLRIAIDEYLGSEYVSLRVWAVDARGDLWPQKKGVSIRVRELRAVAAALIDAADRLENTQGNAHKPRRDAPAPRDGGSDRAPAQRNSGQRSGLPSQAVPDRTTGFSEFE